MLKLDDNIDKIPLIGPKYKRKLSKLEISKVKDLIFHFPYRYEDTSTISKISDLSVEKKRTISAVVDSIKNIRTRNGKFITQALVGDDTGTIEVIWFNQPFLTRSIKPGSNILLNGKLNQNRNKPQLYSPSYEVVNNFNTRHLGRISPIYRACEGITSKWLRARLDFIFKNAKYLTTEVKTCVPQNIAKCYELCGFPEALKQIHFPSDKKLLEQAQKRLAFEELFNIQLKLLRKLEKQKRKKGPQINQNNKIVKKFLNSLPFEPTKAQTRVIQEIISDFSRNYPANRLMQGDVGSGKTVIATAIMLPVLASGFQTAIMAPTAILAKQHYETVQKLLKDFPIAVKLVTGGSQKQGKIVNQKKSVVIIGTHALLHREDELFKKLGLVIIDEQHRFGVKQRKKLVSQVNSVKNRVTPHKLTMTATPIPRSIALTFFGDLELSIVDEMPPGRMPTKTYLVPHIKRSKGYIWIEEQITKHKAQVFWICPLIEDSDKLQTKAVITEYEKLENEIYPILSIDMLHGRLSEEEKNSKIKRMKDGKTDILVSTSVIEVGMDIPDANIIVIEGAERFGLAQLHQLRGRVGRKAGQESWCFLFASKNASPEAIERLKYFSKVNDGLKVAQYDLQRRGPGEVYGTRQAGIPDLKIAKLTDTKLIAQTREAAEKIVKIK